MVMTGRDGAGWMMLYGFQKKIWPTIMWKTKTRKRGESDTFTLQKIIHPLHRDALCRSQSAHVGGSPCLTFSRSGVFSLEITPCAAGSVSVPAVQVVWPPHVCVPGVLTPGQGSWMLVELTRQHAKCVCVCVLHILSLSFQFSQAQNAKIYCRD